MYSDDTLMKELNTPLGDTDRTLHLKTTEMMCLWAMRTLVWSWTHKSISKTEFLDGLEAAGCAEAAEDFGNFLSLIGGGAIKEIRTNHPCHRLITVDEKRLMHTLAAQQAGHSLEAFDVLSSIVAGSAVRLSLEYAEAIARKLGNAGFCMPDRAWALEELAVAEQLRAPSNLRACIRHMIH